MDDCVFCKIVRGEIPTKIIDQDEDLIVFEDIHPQAPQHLLVVPKKHFVDFTDASDDVVLKIKNKILELSKDMESFRVIINGKNAQEVKHLHWHLLGGVV